VEDPKSGNEEQPKWLTRLRRNKWVVVLVTLVVALAALNNILDLPQRARDLYHVFRPAIISVQFNKVSEMPIPRFGLAFSYPSSWDRQDMPTNGDGAEFINPDDRNVSIAGWGSFSGLINYGPTLSDVVKGEKRQILGLRQARIIMETASGVAARDATSEWFVDGWRAEYRYVDESGRSITVMEKLTVSDGREVVLDMKAPTEEFSRYEAAFLQLSSTLQLTPCADCNFK
jgi:hypothetical protein